MGRASEKLRSRLWASLTPESFDLNADRHERPWDGVGGGRLRGLVGDTTLVGKIRARGRAVAVVDDDCRAFPRGNRLRLRNVDRQRTRTRYTNDAGKRDFPRSPRQR